MAKRGRKKKFKVSFNISPETIRSIVAVVLFLLSALIIISFFTPSYTVNAFIQKYLKMVFGYASIVIPFITAIVGFLFVDALKHKIKELRIVVGLVLLIVAVAGFSHIFVDTETSRELALSGGGGGLLGYFISEIFVKTISSAGAFVLLLALLVTSIILIFDLSFDQIIIFASNLLKREKKETDEDDEIEIGEVTENAPMADTLNIKVAPNDIKAPKQEVTEESIEIIPSMAEPQSTAVIANVDTSTAQSSDLPSLPYSDKVWELPPIDLLDEASTIPPDTGNIEQNAKIITDTLNSFNIPTSVVDVQVGPSVTKYALEAPPGVKVAKISNLQYDLALAMASPTGTVRIEAPIPGKSLIGIEAPNRSRSLVNFKSLITSDSMKGVKSKLQVVLGKDVGGITHTYDIAKMPHLLIAGATGSGKSIFIHNLIFSILFKATPQEVKFILVDPKRVELSAYNDIPHLYTPIVTDIEKSPAVFKWAVTEMTRRYKLFESAKARNIESYNEKSGFQALPYIVIIVDELAEIMVADPSAVEKSIIRLAQLARATGIHLVLAAQRPSANVITGLIKANIPCRVAFNVTGQVDSRVIIDQSGAEKLLGKGDMLFVPPDNPTPVRLQGAFLTDNEITKVVNFLKNQGVAPEYKEEILETPTDSTSGKSISAGGDETDELYDDALETVLNAGKASASLLQRRLSIGYARAARILDELQQKGIVGPPKGSKPREVLVDGSQVLDGDDLDLDIDDDEFIAPEPFSAT